MKNSGGGRKATKYLSRTAREGLKLIIKPRGSAILRSCVDSWADPASYRGEHDYVIALAAALLVLVDDA